jgi:four helix bundle protein
MVLGASGGGCTMATNKEFARFLDMSIKSLNETEGHLLTARDLDLFAIAEWKAFTNETIEIRRMTYTYRRKVLESAEDE